MIIDTDKSISITEANQNFSRAVKLADEHGELVIYKRNKPMYILSNIEKASEKQLSDEEITKRLVDDALHSEHASIFLVDLEHDSYQFIYRNTDSGFADVSGGIYSETIREYTSRVDKDYQEEWLKLADAESAREYLKYEDRKEYVYPLTGVEKQWRRCISHVIERHNGVASKFIQTYMAINESAAENLKLSAQVASQQEQMERQQEELREALVKAEAGSESKSSFLFNMSHDIRTPMNAIIGFTMLAKKYIDEKDKVLDYLDNIDVSAKQLLALTDQVLEMSRIESGRAPVSETSVDLKKEFDELVSIFETRAEVRKVRFVSAMENVVHSELRADRVKIVQILMNVIGNSLKYTPAGGTVSFTLRELPCEKSGFADYRFTVKDTGIGMSKGYLARLFEPFTREKNTTQSRIEGSGLGMSIVKQLVDMLGGSIEVSSELGKGSEFNIDLSLKLAETAEAGNPETAGNDLKGRRILLVEDNEMNREIAKDILEERGFTVEEAEDGDVAVERVKEAVRRGDPGYYDCVLMDVQMPRMNGYDATRAIRSIPVPEGVRIPIVAMTANAFEEDRRDAFAAGMDDHLAKPVNVQKMMETIKKYLK